MKPVVRMSAQWQEERESAGAHERAMGQLEGMMEDGDCYQKNRDEDDSMS